MYFVGRGFFLDGFEFLVEFLVGGTTLSGVVEFPLAVVEDVCHFGTGGDIVLVEAFHTWHLGCDLVEDYHGHFFVGGFVGGSGAGRF